MSGENGNEKPGDNRPPGAAPLWKKGASGNPAGAPTHKTVIRKFLEREMSRMVAPPGTRDELIPFAQYAVRYILNQAFNPRPEHKTLPLQLKCLDEVLKRVDPVASAGTVNAVQIVVHGEPQREFWTTVVAKVGDRKVCPADVIDQLDDHGRKPTID
jgi:hypothetical protein